MRKFFYFIILICIAAVLFLLFRGKSDYGELTNRFEQDFDYGSGKVHMTIESYRNKTDTYNIVFYKNGLFGSKKFELSGFEDDIRVCQTSIYEISSEYTALCLTGDVGAHSQNTQFLIYKDGNIQSLDFETDAMDWPNITSDLPRVRIMDYNEDGALDILADQRDYDKNPLKDYIRLYYRYDDGKFVFDHQTFN